MIDNSNFIEKDSDSGEYWIIKDRLIEENLSKVFTLIFI